MHELSMATPPESLAPPGERTADTHTTPGSLVVVVVVVVAG